MSKPRADIARQALELIGNRIRVDLEITIVGGAAAALIGLLPPTHATNDLDVIQFLPPVANEELLRVAGEVGRELSLDPDWLNEHSRLYFHELPDGWRERTALVGRFGHLTVMAIGRGDFIAMKFYAHRQDDLEHLAAIDPAVTAEELWFTEQYLDSLMDRQQGDPSRIEMSRSVLNGWRARHGGRG